jgi:hypothetical protein
VLAGLHTIVRYENDNKVLLVSSYWYVFSENVDAMRIYFSDGTSSENARSIRLSGARPYKPWAGVQHRIVTQDLPCNHTMAKTSRLNVEQ